ncbi:DUF4350 domain-containing protein [Candidatus Thiothrix anitrata]|uniref:DUF4350 domain-containing protein n=1 Tax=Candidatus Thiothrix anitrata TaxID=2823902 RepID=A0ABX7X5D6_9GAMM|nr:DUF4350 domain-containing protein [Candidatus Thiothrix anitrata]QTR49818.1 DUF4350 domain-containing protein [Candidatus Thiothrix anitrata]
MKAQRIALGLLGILVLVGLTLSFLNTFELKESEEHVGFKGEAKTNNLFAARLLLHSMGVPAQRQDRLSTLPDTDTVLIINTQRYTLSSQKIEALLAWVERGGHLITRARTDESSSNLYSDDTEDEDATKPRTTEPKTDPLQSALGITLGENIIPEEDDLPLSVVRTDYSKVLEVDPGFFDALETTAAVQHQQTYQNDAWLLEIKRGAGLITLAANLDFIENPAIDDYDHAEFFWHLIHSLHPQPQNVWLIHQDDLPPLWALLWERAWPLLLTLGVAIPLGILALSPRFGPLQQTPSLGRRRILEHIHASGRFMWKRHQQGDTQYPAFTDAVKQLSPKPKDTP